MLFARYPATPGAIRACADDLFAGSSQVCDVRSAVASRHANAVAAVDGLLRAPVVSALAPVAELVGTVSAAAGVAGEASNLFADAVATYDAGIDRLNLEYEAARAASFHVGPRADLDEAAAATAAVLHRGPGVGSVRFLAANNAFPTFDRARPRQRFGSDDDRWVAGWFQQQLGSAWGVGCDDGEPEVVTDWDVVVLGEAEHLGVERECCRWSST